MQIWLSGGVRCSGGGRGRLLDLGECHRGKRGVGRRMPWLHCDCERYETAVMMGDV